MSELRPVPGSPPPSALLLPDGTAVPLRAWKALLVEVARALVRAGKLGPQRCPVHLPRAQKRYLVHTEPVHPSGQQFRASEPIDDRLWIETHASAKLLVKQTQWLLEQFGEDPARYRVRPGQPGQQP